MKEKTDPEDFSATVSERPERSERPEPALARPTAPSSSTVSRGGARPAAEAPTLPHEGAVAVRRAGEPTTDLQVLLRGRLRFIAVLMAAGMAIAILLVLLSPNPWSTTAIYGAFFAAVAALAGILLIKPSLSLRQLRVIELVLFGTLFAFWGGGQATVYPTFRLSDPPVWFAAIMAYAMSLPWAFLILIYAIFIPNTWQRCAAVVGTGAAIPFVIAIATGAPTDAGGRHGPSQFLVVMAVWMAAAAAFAIYGAHRIEVLRVTASQARKLGQYQLKERLGSGGMGEVYLAQHTLLRRPCAVKLIRPERAGDPSVLRRFEREVQATATLTHPNTVQIFDYGHADDGTFYYAMEYLPGINLEQLVAKHGPLRPERVIHFLRQVCGALAEAHAAGLVHRDIKPSNVIACARGGRHDMVKLLDFGLVRSLDPGAGADSLTLEGAIAGTPAYMSPEQADGKKDLDARCDIYSLGAAAYYLLTGRPPFVRPTPLQTLIAHVSDPPVPPTELCAEVPADLEQVVLRCLAKDPGQRFADARSVELALGACDAAGRWSEERATAWWQAHAPGACF